MLDQAESHVSDSFGLHALGHGHAALGNALGPMPSVQSVSTVRSASYSQSAREQGRAAPSRGAAQVLHEGFSTSAESMAVAGVDASHIMNAPRAHGTRARPGPPRRVLRLTTVDFEAQSSPFNSGAAARDRSRRVPLSGPAAEHSLAVDLDTGAAWGWGRVQEGQLGCGSVSAGGSRGDRGGTRRDGASGGGSGGASSGGSGAGRVGRGSRLLCEWYPRMIRSLRAEWVVDAAAGGHHSVFLTDEGMVWTCGDGASGQLGLGRGVQSLDRPELIPPASFGERVFPHRVSAGKRHTVAFDRVSGQLFTWGETAGGLGWQ